jgi:hypothetical protein
MALSTAALMTASVSGLVACPAAGAVGVLGQDGHDRGVLLVDFAGAGAHGQRMRVASWIRLSMLWWPSAVAGDARVDGFGRVVGVGVGGRRPPVPGGSDGCGFGGGDGVGGAAGDGAAAFLNGRFMARMAAFLRRRPGLMIRFQ